MKTSRIGKQQRLTFQRNAPEKWARPLDCKIVMIFLDINFNEKIGFFTKKNISKILTRKLFKKDCKYIIETRLYNLESKNIWCQL